MARKCPIVGIGASAGGLAALKTLLENTPADIGAAFVIIQHLDPTHASFTAEILARHTKLPTKQAEDGERIEANHVYVIPPDADLTLKGNKFVLARPAQQHGARTPIDLFLTSLAAQDDRWIAAIILSGSGKDGSAGVPEINAAGGIVFVQTPQTAQFDGMPSAAIATGLVDVVCPVEDMPGRIGTYLAGRRIRRAPKSADAESDKDFPAALASIITLLNAHLGHNFSGYKKGTLERRVIRRMAIRNIGEISEYLKFLRENEEEIKELYNDFLIGVTAFFRDPEAFDALDKDVLSELASAKRAGEPIRVWVPGCSSGEEAYSIAMLLIEKCEALDKDASIQIFASDIDERALATGRAGVYPASQVGGISAERLRRFFSKLDGGYRVSKELRDKVVFAAHDIISDAPFSRLDLVSCRNLLIYLEPRLQEAIIGYFYFALAKGGYLFLGRSEGAGQLSGLFKPVDKKSRIFRRIDNARPGTKTFPATPTSVRTLAEFNHAVPAPSEAVRLRDLMQRELLRSYAPAAVLTNARHQVLYFMGPTSRFLEQPSGAPTQDLLSLAPAELRKNLRAGLEQAGETAAPVVLDNVPIRRGGQGRRVDLTIAPLAVPGESEALLMVTFTDAAASRPENAPPPKDAPASPAAASDLESKLHEAQEDLQITLEELESTNEELQASNEEIMSTNEELQSTNEELETSKEELQAMNEELSTLNSQLKDKIEELGSVNEDLENFVESTGIATLLLDPKRRIGRFTPAAKKLFHLIDSDIGRPLSDIRQKFADDDFLLDVDAVLREFRVIEREISAHDGTFYIMRLAPCRVTAKHLGGVVVTFVDISQRLKNERQLRESEARFRDLVESAPDPLLLVGAKGEIVLANSEAQQFFGYSRQELVEMTVDGLLPERYRARHIAHRRQYMKDARSRPMGSGLELLALTKQGEELPIEISLSPIKMRDGVMVCAAIRDIREHRSAMLAIREAKAKAEFALAAKARFLATASHDLRQPLQSLSMLNEAILLKIEDPTVVEIAKQQSLAVASMRGLLNSLLDISKLDADGVPVAIRDVDLRKTIDEVCAGFQSQVRSKGLKMTVAAPRRMVRTDPALFEQMLQNLIGNAVRYTAKGEVAVVASVSETTARIAVKDTGAGIATDQLSHIFEEFYQVGRDPQQSNAGLGLGLAIVSRIAEKLGTGIDVVSTVGEGSTFSFELPLSQALPQREKTASDPGAQTPPPKNVTVLLVDDDPGVLKSTTFRLSAQKGFQVLAARSPSQVTEILGKEKRSSPDVVVTDYHLGSSKSGLDIIAQARQHAGRELPAIVISGDTALDTRELEKRNIAVLAKPTGGHELVDTIVRMLVGADGPTKR